MRLLIILLLLSYSASAQVRGKVVGVHDGDTFTILLNNKQERVRLRSIDCPELGQSYGRNAKQFTSDAAFGKTVLLADTSRDRYGRMLATVVLPTGDTLNTLLVAAGLAWQYVQYDNSRHLHDIEQQARSSGMGLWSQNNVIAPWIWRKK